MFLVLNKEKIYAYLVSILTVCLLFFIASTNAPKDVETSTSADNSNSAEANSYIETNTLEDANLNVENKKNANSKDNQNEEESSLVPNDETNSIDTSGDL